MENQPTIFILFVIFAGAAVFSTVAVYLRQSLLVAYMLFGVVFGPWGLKILPDINVVNKVDDIGIILFMFLLGLHLQPKNLMHMIGRTIWITLASSIVFFIVGFIVGYWYNYNLVESSVIGICMMFSSTIVSLKLFPFRSAHTQHAADIMIGILLLQDLIAIIVLLGISATNYGEVYFSEVMRVILALPSIWLFAWLVEKFVLSKVFAKFAGAREYILLISIAWCLGISELAQVCGLSYEVGAFIAGLAIAISPISLYIYEQLKPIRDFFLVLFFFIIGAGFNFQYFYIIVMPAIILTVLFVVLKPLVFYFLLGHVSEPKHSAQEVGLRLGQLSEFSLLIVFVAYQNKVVGYPVIYIVQMVTMFMFIISSYLIGVWYPVKEEKRVLSKTVI